MDMKNLLRAVMVLTVLVLAGIAALAFWVGSQVEELARREIAAFADAASIAGQVRLSAPEVKEIKFSPLSRRLTLRGAEMRGEMPSLPGSSLLYTLEEASFRLPLRVLLLFTPLRNTVLPEKGMLTVCESMRISNFASTISQGSTSARSTVRSEEANQIRLESGLLQELLEGTAARDTLKILYRMGIGELRASSVASSINMPDQGLRLDFNCDSMQMRNWEGRFTEQASLDGILLKEGEKELLRLGNLTVTGYTMPEEATARKLLALTDQPRPDRLALRALLLGMFASGEPLVRKISATDLSIPLDNQHVSCKNFTLSWPSNTPLKYGCSLERLSLPTALVERKSRLSLPGLPAFVLDAQLDFESRGNGVMHEQGTISAQTLGALEYDFVISGGAASLSLQALLAKTFSDVRLKYTDQRLTAYLVSNAVPVAQAATPALKTGIAQFCSGDSPENTALRAALETFVTSPGVLEIRSRPGKSFRLLEVTSALAKGNLAALFNVTAQAGKKSLEEQINALNTASTPADEVKR